MTLNIYAWLYFVEILLLTMTLCNNVFELLLIITRMYMYDLILYIDGNMHVKDDEYIDAIL